MKRYILIGMLTVFSFSKSNPFISGVDISMLKQVEENGGIFYENGNQIEDNEYNSDGSLNQRKTYKYDEQGNIIEKNRYHSDDALYERDTYNYKYDNMGNWIERESYGWYYSEDRNYKETVNDAFIVNAPRRLSVRKIEYYE